MRRKIKNLATIVFLFSLVLFQFNFNQAYAFKILKIIGRVGSLPDHIAVNPVTNKAYVTFSLDSQKVVVIGE